MIFAKRTEKIHILIVGTQCLSYTSLAALLTRHPHLQIVGAVQTLPDVARRARNTQLDLLLVDLDCREGIDTELVKSLRTQLPALPVITLSSRLDASTLVALLTAGTQAYLTKEITEGELVAVIEAVARGEPQQFVSTTFLKSSQVSPNNNRLTTREQQVVTFLLHGLDLEQIARAMQINYQTVRNYTCNIYDKVGVHSQTELILRLTQRQNQ